MLDSIIGLVKDQVLSSVTNGKIDIPADKKDQVIDTTTNSLVDSLKSNFTLDNMSSIVGMFSGQGSTSNNFLTNTIQSSVASALSEKAGLSKDMSNTIAAVAIPAVMSMFQNKVNDPNDSNFTVDSLIKTFSGGKGGGILGVLSGFFGKK